LDDNTSGVVSVNVLQRNGPPINALGAQEERKKKNGVQG